MFFGVLRTKIKIQKLPTVVGSFRIRIFLRKTHVFWCFTNPNPNTWVVENSVFRCSIPKFFWYLTNYNPNTETVYNCSQFPYLVFTFENAWFFGVLATNIKIWKLHTVVFPIQIFHSKTHVTWCFTNNNPNTETIYNSSQFRYQDVPY